MSMSLTPEVEALLAENYVGTLTTVRPDGSPHVAPVRFTWDGSTGLARVMTVDSRHKVRNLRLSPHSRVAVCQPMGPRWITLEGTATVTDDPDRVAEGIRCYAKRYRSPPPPLPGLVVIEIVVDRAMGIP